MANEQTVAKIRAALAQLDPKNDAHWTDDGLPRTGVVQKLASDPNLTRKEIQEANPGFQREPTKPAVTAGDDLDPLTGEPGSGTGVVEGEGLGDPTKNTGDLMSEAEVRAILEGKVKDAIHALDDAQQGVRDAHNLVTQRQTELTAARADLTREFPPMTAAENVKAYIASEVAQRAAAFAPHGIAPGSQIDAAMQRSNSRGWRRPTRNNLPTQSGAAKAA
jgi:hypothetical protein